MVPCCLKSLEWEITDDVHLQKQESGSRYDFLGYSSSETVWGEDITGVTWLLHAQVIVTAGFKPFTLTILAVVIKMNEYVQDYSELTVIRTQTVVK